MAKNILRRSRFDSIGSADTGILTAIVYTNQMLKDFDILAGFIYQCNLVKKDKKDNKEEVDKNYALLKEKYKSIADCDNVFNPALEEISEEQRYGLAGLKYSFDLSDNYCSAFLAQKRQPSLGFMRACLNDSNAALAVYVFSPIEKDGELIFTADIEFLES